MFSHSPPLSCALNLSARAQTPSIEVSTDAYEAQFAVEGHARQMRVEIFSPSGELVFETDSLDGQSIRWPMVTASGERVADGVYLAAITVTDPSGKRRKRIEQISVSSAAQGDTTGAAAPPSPEPLTTPSGSGTAGKIAKWSSATDLGNSIMTESANKIGVNLATPLATLHVNNPTLPASSATNGAAATPLLQTGGGKGGNTVGTTGQKAGNGASISLAAGNGGDAPCGKLAARAARSLYNPAESAAARPGRARAATSCSRPRGSATSASARPRPRRG